MKIVVVGVSRSRTTVLIEKLKLLNPELNCFDEFYKDYYKYKIDALSECHILNLTKNLFKYEDFIVKIISNSVDEQFNDLLLNEYDKIYLIERPDFFHQCCSFQVSMDNKVWHQRNNHIHWESIKKRKSKLLMDNILIQAEGVDCYIKIKQYLSTNNINYVLHDYNDFDLVPKNIISDPKIPYSQVILNYKTKNIVDNLFKKYFNYDELRSDFFGFKEELQLYKEKF